eukprot:10550516-Prorocentrum_lima.AAC.1
MTSSLVGSEMCIRDSNSTQPDRHTPFPSLPPFLPSVRQCHATRSSALPVSYTHLTLPTICSV